MHSVLANYIHNSSGFILALVMVVAIFTLSVSADKLVDIAVGIATKINIPKSVVGATIVALGTTLPETVVSVIASLNGTPDVALGNAVGSIICDTGLILGVLIVFGTVKKGSILARKQGAIQLLSALALIIFAMPLNLSSGFFTTRGSLSQIEGVFLLFALVGYLYWSFSYARKKRQSEAKKNSISKAQIAVDLFKLILASFVVIVSSNVLLEDAIEISKRLMIPEGVIAATIVAFGTSLPELVTAIAAIRKKHESLALGNIIGADILNALFVAGAAAAVSINGLSVDTVFLTRLFPAMLAILIVFNIGLHTKGKVFPKGFGLVLLLCYLGISLLSLIN